MSRAGLVGYAWMAMHTNGPRTPALNRSAAFNATSTRFLGFMPVPAVAYSAPSAIWLPAYPDQERAALLALAVLARRAAGLQAGAQRVDERGPCGTTS